MADNAYDKKENPEIKPEAPKAAPEQKPGGKEIKEATVSVGIEAGEVIEGAEVTSGEVSETEKRTKEGYAGGGVTAGTSTGAGGTRKIKYPSKTKMTHQVEKELRKEMKFLNKKIRKTVKERDANSLNSLVARLRELQRLLSKLANATAEMIKDMWIAYVKEKK